ncbi:hypothetical protein [Shimazuella kribbensis]|uniref:hypothetical protein n=1 Tax=Shimazuella kribbensis TaxID=139808 RepID=UPI00048E4717|nr:hypothetical protein [Shimazuella kribbensis]
MSSSVIAPVFDGESLSFQATNASRPVPMKVKVDRRMDPHTQESFYVDEEGKEYRIDSGIVICWFTDKEGRVCAVDQNGKVRFPLFM